MDIMWSGNSFTLCVHALKNISIEISLIPTASNDHHLLIVHDKNGVFVVFAFFHSIHSRAGQYQEPSQNSCFASTTTNFSAKTQPILYTHEDPFKGQTTIH